MDSIACKDCGKEFQSNDALQQHQSAKHSKTKPIKPNSSGSTISMKKVGIAAVILIVVAVGAWLLLAPGTKVVGNYDSFAQCLNQKGVVMYGAYWCPHCAKQKEDFGASFQYVNYVECDPGGENAQPQLCNEKGVTGYPTWIYNGKSRSGEQTLQSLGDWAKCPLSP